MKYFPKRNIFTVIGFAFVVNILTSGCSSSKRYSGFTTVRKYQKNSPFVFKNNISLQAEDATSDEKVLINGRLYNQLDDSARVRVKDIAFIFHTINKPPVFDTNAIIQSAKNMQTAMRNLGFYHPDITYEFDTLVLKEGTQRRVIVNYDVVSGKRTLVDTLAYLITKPDMQKLAVSTKDQAIIKRNDPVTKAGVQEETNRLVNLYRNNGYYKMTADLIRVTGDTSIAALTTVSEDPFEQLRLLAEAAQAREKPTIRIGYQLNITNDSSKLEKYTLRNIYVLPDYTPGDNLNDTSLQVHIANGIITKYHEKRFRFYLPESNIFLKKNELFKQDDYYKTLENLYRLGVWESPTIDLQEVADSNQIDVVIKLIPLKKYSFEGNIELSYSANSTTSNITAANSGNLLGIAGNLNILNKNVAKKAIRMSHSFRAGVQFNTSRRNSSGTFINSNELTYSNNILFPKFIFPFHGLGTKNLITHQSFVNSNVSLVNRIDFFNQQIFALNYGFNFTSNENHIWSFRLFNFDYHRLYNRSASFDATLEKYPFLRYSFNTALVIGVGLSYKSTLPVKSRPNHIRTFKGNLEESGLIFGLLKSRNKNPQTGNFFDKYLKEFIKTDAEFTYTINHPKSALAVRLFAGVGIPVSKTDTTLPFFKQYFGGGPNSMRGWPVRGIGLGGQSLAPFVNNALFNDRTGDIQLEGNAEYRFNVAPLFSNAIFFKMALFADAGNIWNFKNTAPGGVTDTTQFSFSNLYKQLGLNSGVGFRFDFSYFLIRFDVGFRFKRPDILEKNGWQFPDITLPHLFGAGVENRRWRYNNMNATIGIDYPF